MALRLFVAVGLDPDARAALDHALARARTESPAALRWVEPERWHFTLQFLGSTSEDRVASLERALASVAGRHAPFDLALKGAGAFPAERHARVVWIGVEAGADALTHLAADVVLATSALGFAAEERPFHPHLTVARLRRPGSVARIVAAMQSPPIESPVRELVLYRSHLAQTGARYEALATLRLGK